MDWKKYSLFFALFLTTALQAAEDEFTFEGGCDSPVFCAAVEGEYSKGATKIDGVEFTATGTRRTCCQLASEIFADACKDGNDPKGAVVACSR
jgi:hypothetical protein